MSKSRLDYYRLKLTYQAEADDGALTTFKDESITQACSYTEAEAVANALAEDLGDIDGLDIEITRTKISELAYNPTFTIDENMLSVGERKLITYWFMDDDDPEIGLYAVSLIYTEINEKTGKEKKTSDTIYVPANSSKEAIDNINAYLKAAKESREWTIRNVKYDKARTVLVDPEQHQNNMRVYDGY